MSFGDQTTIHESVYWSPNVACGRMRRPVKVHDMSILGRGLEGSEDMKQVLKEVKEFGRSFAMPGFDVTAIQNSHSNGHASSLSNGFGDSNGLPKKGNDLSTSTAFDPKAEHADIAN